MLTHLHIGHFAIIPELALDFRPGFTTITGETGAGKSILVDALGLLLGDRSDSSWVRQGADKAELAAEFELDHCAAARDWLRSAGLASNDQCLLRRSIAANGRSRAWINGTPVTLQQLGELGGLLVEIHGQNEHVLLTRPARQFELLDDSGHYPEQRTQVEQAFELWKSLQDDFERLEQQSGMSPAEQEYLRFQLSELEEQALSPDEVAALELEHRRLARGGALLETLSLATQTLAADENGGEQALQTALTQLEPLRTLDNKVDEACKMLSEALINCQEAIQSIQSASDRVDLSPERLQAVSDQLGELADLGRKHRVPLEDLQRVRDELAERLELGESFESRRAELEQQREQALQAYRASAASLSESRKRHAVKLSSRISELMGELGMEGGVLQIQLEYDGTSPPSPGGDDRIAMLVSANPGIQPGPLSKIASGGELSRISLAIKVAAGSGNTGTQVFDEVDAGVGGETAHTVGRLLSRLARGTQSLCVTHLAQVAACADHQYRVAKEVSGQQTAVETRLLNRTERIDEIARMLGGRISEQSRKHAAEMLDSASMESLGS